MAPYIAAIYLWELRRPVGRYIVAVAVYGGMLIQGLLLFLFATNFFAG